MTSQKNSDIVVISWWSNVLALQCLSILCSMIKDRKIYVVQCGKSDGVKDLFRKNMPENVKEIDYDSRAPQDHWQVITTLIQNKLKDSPGLWFIDHDVFFKDRIDSWFPLFDAYAFHHSMMFSYADIGGQERKAITSPAFWVAPCCLPEETPDFSPYPLSSRQISGKSGHEMEGTLCIPEKDTLVRAMEYLSELNAVKKYAIDSENRNADIVRIPLFPAFHHIGCLYLLKNNYADKETFERVFPYIDNVLKFYESCHAQTLAIENPEIIQRISKFKCI